MPNGTDTVTVQKQDGSIVTIPKSSLPIALRMKAKLYNPKPTTPPTSTLSKLDVGLQQGVAQSLGVKLRDTERPETTTWGDIGSQVGSNLYKAGKESLKRAGPLAPIDMIASGIEGAASSLERGGKTVYQGIKSGDAETFARGGGEMLGTAGQIFTGAEGEKLESAVRAEPPEEIVQRSTGGAKDVLTSIFNEGATKEKMQKLQDYDALNTKAKLSKLDRTVKADAGGLMQRTSQAIDQKFPEGSTDLSATAKVIKDGLGERVKARTLRAKLPPSMTKILDESGGGTKQKGTATRLTQNELQTLNVLMKEGAKGEDLRGSLVNMGYAPKQIDAMLQVAGGTEATPALSGFEKMKQLRTELGEELFTKASDKYPGPVRRVMFDTWNDMTKQLDSAAEKAGLVEDWKRGKQKYSDYMRDFYGSWERGKYNQSPIDKVLKGQNSKEIMEPMAGASSQQVRDLLKKYGQYGLDPAEVTKDVRRYSRNQKVMRFASPSKYDIIMLGMALYRPEYGIPALIARYGLPRITESLIARRAAGMESLRPSIPTVPEAQSQQP